MKVTLISKPLLTYIVTYLLTYLLNPSKDTSTRMAATITISSYYNQRLKAVIAFLNVLYINVMRE